MAGKLRYIEAPNVYDLPNFNPGIATAALSHLFEQAQAGNLEYYRATVTGAWFVGIPTRFDRRLMLAEFVCEFEAGTLPTQTPAQRGA